LWAGWCLREGSLAGRDVGETGPDGVAAHVWAWAAWLQACGSAVASRRVLRLGLLAGALRLRVGVVDPGAKRRIWD
jgi:hypothetical protein